MKKLTTAEKLVAAAIVLVLLAIAAVFIWWRSSPAASPVTQPLSSDDETPPSSQELSSPEDYLPQKLVIGKAPPRTKLFDETGGEVDLAQYKGKKVLVIFWGSWCKYCKEQLEIASDIALIASANDAEVVLIDKLDAQKESRQAALDELEKMNIGFTNLFDDGLAVYEAWGLKRIPTSVVLDENGAVRAFATKVLTAGEYEALFEYADDPAAATLGFVKRELTGENGGVYCASKSTGSSPTGKDTLSETQGLMLLFALERRDKALFNELWSFTSSQLESDGLAAWYVGESGKGAANATLDDMRIWSALTGANALWGGYEDSADAVLDAIYTRCIRDDKLVSFCELQGGAKASSLSLCYADFDILSRMATADERFAAVYENAVATVDGGYISDDFPLYYAAYDYDTKSYSTDSLNTAEALYTLWNLAKADKLSEKSESWLLERAKSDTLAARYNTDGSVVAGFDYHSTAVYALSYLIGQETDNTELMRISLMRMERYRIGDSDEAYYGAFGDPNAAIYSFDQCMPLLVYSTMTER